MEDVESLLSQTLSQDKATSSAVGQLRTHAAQWAGFAGSRLCRLEDSSRFDPGVWLDLCRPES